MADEGQRLGGALQQLGELAAGNRHATAALAGAGVAQDLREDLEASLDRVAELTASAAGDAAAAAAGEAEWMRGRPA